MSFLRKVFGPSQEEIWQQLCNEIGAEFVQGGLWKGNKVVARVKEWTITLDTYSQTTSTGKTTTTYTYTRLRAPYVNQDGFRFKIYRRGLFEGLRKFFGGQDIQVGYPDFDDDFIIKGNNPLKVVQLFANPKIRQLIQAQPQILFEVKDDEGWFSAKFPEGVDELYFQVSGTIKDVARLKLLYDLFAETLNHLCEIGSAYEGNPNCEL
jgi:hypothetical protein